MSILDRIVADTKDLVALARRKNSLDELRSGPFFNSPTLPLASALRSDDLAYIAEVKKASPSKGIIRYNFDVRSIALGYKLGGASVLSVLTEPAYFHGSLSHLALARQAVDLPLLRKDFIVDSYQLYEARAFGADAVLLIAAVLDASQLKELYAEAASLDLGCLVEVYDARELDKLDLDQIEVLGVNNRDLNTFEVDIRHSLEVFASVPARLIRVSESGLGDPLDLAHLQGEGVDAVLIGETFMRADEPGRCLRDLREQVAGHFAEQTRPTRLRRVV